MKPETTASRLNFLLKERHLKQVDILKLAEPFCAKFGVKLGKTDLSQYVSGKVAPGQDKLTILGLALNVNEAWLMGYDVPAERNAPTTETSDGREKLERALTSIGIDLSTITEAESLKIAKLAKLALEE